MPRPGCFANTGAPLAYSIVAPTSRGAADLRGPQVPRGAVGARYFSINYPDFSPYITPAFSPYITPAFSGVLNKGGKFKTGCITPAFGKVPPPHPCIRVRVRVTELVKPVLVYNPL